MENIDNISNKSLYRNNNHSEIDKIYKEKYENIGKLVQSYFRMHVVFILKEY